MKIGMRKPSMKKSIKARTTGRAKRTVKKAVIPGYGKKGMGWVKNPKKAAYNKVYNKTTFGVNDIVRATSASGSSKSHSSKVRSSSPAKKSAPATSAPVKVGYNVLAKDKPTSGTPIVTACLGLAITLFFSKAIGVFLLLIAMYFLYDYEHRSKTHDYISEEDLDTWVHVLAKYDPSILNHISYGTALGCTKQILSSRFDSLKPYYDMISGGKVLSQNNKLALIDSSNAVIDLEKYVTYNMSDVRFLPDAIRAKREKAITSYIDEEYNKAKKHASELKTEKGKQNQIEKYKETVSGNLAPLCNTFETHMESKIIESDFQ